ncbi:M23 family metallopeptidase [Polyangium aurulentum]|uniref:M23 family metallopeptidase n=1 Tax=Polyangium aurulentum TaxID=2567896 RepID=UPI00146B092E|nr:M23 family metallopeptidase [Polyangium aurulentum]UQA60147.1 M23 family metallopeptidase [Polyangium aurulentum]
MWPISGDGASDFPLSSTFGPRVRTEDQIYDFHRGIDIAAEVDSDVYAIAAGRVVQIQENTSAGGMLVQLEHPGPYYSNYIHLLDVDVDIGDEVDAGEDIGDSGRASNGFAHLHLEIRKPGDTKNDCVHPLSVLPYEDTGAPSLTIDKVNIENPNAPIVTVTASVPARELDLKSVTIATYEAPPGLVLDDQMPLSEKTFDVDDWNRTYTELDSDALIDTPNLDGIRVSPQKYNATMGTFSMELTFSKLVGPGSTGLRVKATATDVRGNAFEVTSP